VRKIFKILPCRQAAAALMRASFSAKTPAAALIIGNFIRKLAGKLWRGKV